MVVVCCTMGMLGCGNAEDAARGFNERLVTAQCANLFRCANRHGGAGLRAAYGTEDRCVAESAAATGIFGQPQQALIEANRVRFDADAAERCLALWADSCMDSFERDAVCASVWVGVVADGDGCVDDAECASGVCTGSLEACGSCAASVALGGECDEERPCAPSEDGAIECYSPDGSPRVCVLRAPFEADAVEGDPCVRIETGDVGCGVGLFCSYGICAARAELGAPCEPMLDSCETGAVCQADSATCVALRVESTLGEPCGAQGDEFVTCDVTEGLVCGRSAACVREVSRPGEGEPCAGIGCAVGLVCALNRCTSPLAEGERCLDHHHCASMFCDKENQVCAAWPSCS